MYFPDGLRQRAKGPGSILLAGATALSVAFAAVAEGLIGVAIAVGVLIVCFFAEVWRDASGLKRERDELRSKLRNAELQADAASGMRERIGALERTVQELQEQLGRPRLGQEAILESLGAHLDFIDMARHHRELRPQIPDAPVTRIELSAEETAKVTAFFAEGVQQVNGELLALVETETGQSFSAGEAVADGQQAQVELDLAGLPPSLADELERQGTSTPTGYVLRLAGLCLWRYSELSDNELIAVKDAFDQATRALSRTAASASADDVLAELEAEQEVTSPLPEQDRDAGIVIEEKEQQR